MLHMYTTHLMEYRAIYWRINSQWRRIGTAYLTAGGIIKRIELMHHLDYQRLVKE